MKLNAFILATALMMISSMQAIHKQITPITMETPAPDYSPNTFIALTPTDKPDETAMNRLAQQKAIERQMAKMQAQEKIDDARHSCIHAGKLCTLPLYCVAGCAVATAQLAFEITDRALGCALLIVCCPCITCAKCCE